MSPWDFFSRFRSERLREVNPTDEFRTTFRAIPAPVRLVQNSTPQR